MNEPVRGGEPEVAVNPRHPNDLVLGHTVVGNTYANNTTAAGEEAVDGGLQASHDGGKTWTADRPLHTSGFKDAPNPYLIAHGFPTATGYTSTTNGAGDPIEASGPDGSIYAGGVLAHTTPGGPPPFNFTVPQGGIAVARSSNGGRTFGPISAVLTDQEVARDDQSGDDPEGNPRASVSIPFDRPWIAVDQSTGAVYVSTTGHPQRYVTVSHDKARTWGRIEALDCDEATPPDANHHVSCSTYPQIGDGNIAAAHGILAAVYTASAAPGRTCPCAIFETSTDAGAHWTRHVVSAEVPNGTGLFVAADPSHKGRFAVLIMPGNTVAGGLRGPFGIEERPARSASRDDRRLGKAPGQHRPRWETNPPAHHQPALDRLRTDRACSPRCGATRTRRTTRTSFLVPGTQNVFAAVSRNNGKTFSAPVQLNSASSPPPDPKQLAEDDVSWVVVTPQYVYGAWGDWRPTTKNPVAAGSSPPSGELNSWIARVPIENFPSQ